MEWWRRCWRAGSSPARWWPRVGAPRRWRTWPSGACGPSAWTSPTSTGRSSPPVTWSSWSPGARSASASTSTARWSTPRGPPGSPTWRTPARPRPTTPTWCSPPSTRPPRRSSEQRAAVHLPAQRLVHRELPAVLRPGRRHRRRARQRGRRAGRQRTEQEYAEAAAVVLQSAASGETAYAGAVLELSGDNRLDLRRPRRRVRRDPRPRRRAPVAEPRGAPAGAGRVGLDEGTAGFVVALDQNIRAGLLAVTTGDLARVIGRRRPRWPTPSPPGPDRAAGVAPQGWRPRRGPALHCRDEHAGPPRDAGREARPQLARAHPGAAGRADRDPGPGRLPADAPVHAAVHLHRPAPPRGVPRRVLAGHRDDRADDDAVALHRLLFGATRRRPSCAPATSWPRRG